MSPFVAAVLLAEMIPAHNNPTVSAPAPAVGLPGVGLAVLIIATVTIIFVAFINARGAAPTNVGADGQFDRSLFFRSPTWRFLQTSLIGLLAIASAWHSLLSPAGPDTTTLTFLALIVIIALVPLIEKIVFPGSGEIDLLKAQEIKSDTLELEQNSKLGQIAMATAGKVIAEAQTTLAVQLRQTQSGQARADLIERVLSETTSSISELLRPPPPPIPSLAERLRITAWVTARHGAALTFVLGWPQDLTSSCSGVFTDVADGDPASIAFRTGQTVSYPDLTPQSRPPQPAIGTSHEPLDLHGILIIPMFAGGRVIGVLQVERELSQRFDPAQVVLAKALAALFSLALS